MRNGNDKIQTFAKEGGVRCMIVARIGELKLVMDKECRENNDNHYLTAMT